MSSLPVLLMNPRVLLIGGGNVAYRKACVLVDNGTVLRAVATSFRHEFDELDIELGLICKSVDAEDLLSFDVVVDATGSPGVAEMVLREKQKRNFLVNIAAEPERSDFYFPAIQNYGLLKVAVSTDGASPVIGKAVRDRIVDLLPDDLDGLVQEKMLDRKSRLIEPERTKTQILERLAGNNSPKK